VTRAALMAFGGGALIEASRPGSRDQDPDPDGR